MSPGPLARLGSWFEGLVLGSRARLYRQFVRAVVVATGLLVAANALVVLDLLPVGAGLADALWAAGAVALALFVLAGVVEAVVLARAYERGTREVAATAAELETAATDVAQTAEELETAADDVETAATEVESAVPAEAAAGDGPEDSPVDPDAVERVDEAKARASEAKSTTETAKETASEVAETAAEKRERVAGEGEGPAEEAVDGDEGDERS